MKKLSRLVLRDKDSTAAASNASSGKAGDGTRRSGRSSDTGLGPHAWVDPNLFQRPVPRRGTGASDGPDEHETLTTLIDAVKDYQLTHGSLIKLVRTEEQATILARPIGATLHPLPYPRRCFDLARRLQPVYNELYTAVSTDAAWLAEALQPLLRTSDSFASRLWAIHTAVQAEGYAQEWALGIFRSDYILHVDPQRPQHPAIPKQVEFNTFSCAGIAHAQRVTDMHRHLCRAGFYDDLAAAPALAAMPATDGVTEVVAALAQAQAEYARQRSNSNSNNNGSGNSSGSSSTGAAAVLMVVQHFNANVADERPFEYGLWARGVPAYHVVWGAELLRCTTLTADRTLLFHPPGRTGNAAPPIEVAVVYHRAGYDEQEYATPAGRECRLRCERSRAITCPSVLAHLAGFKMVQQALASPGALLRFVSPDKAARLVDSFAPLYPLDTATARGRHGRELATDPATAADHVLKPSLEGGGHNVYGSDVPAFLAAQPPDEWDAYILQQRICPPPAHHVLIGPRGLYAGAVESELGIVGTCLWRNHPPGDHSPDGAMPLNATAGFTLKTKALGVDEMSVIKGYGCFDSPVLVDE